MPASSMKSFARSASVLALLALAVRADEPRVVACGFGFESLADLTTFEPQILGDDTWDGLFFDPFLRGFGGACEDCAPKAIADDWAKFLGPVQDWDKVLRTASESELRVLFAYTSGKAKAPPRGYEKIPVGPKLAAAIAYVQALRDEPPAERADKKFPARMLAESKVQKEPFLAQRYAYLAVRGAFYAGAWKDCIAMFDATQGAGPSTDLRWRARYYAAGALVKAGQRGRANLELARITSGYQPLAGAAAQDFTPMEEKDWAQTLALASTPREKAQLWRLVGIKQDGIVALEKILAIDPKSNLIGLLLVRELTRAENQFAEGEDKTAGKKALARIEQLALKVAATPGADRPWIAELVAGHVAAKRGDLVPARLHLQKAVALAPANHDVATQAKASLALALVLDWKIDAAHEEELANLMVGVDPKFSRFSAVSGNVRSTLAKAYALAGRIVDSEFLSSGAGQWTDLAFVKQMIERSGKQTSAFDRFVVNGITKQQLQDELFGRYLMMGDFVDAAKTVPAKQELFGTDPFVTHIIDCHDCDHDTYAKAPWNASTFVAKLVELQKTAAGKSEAAAKANLELGTAMYNLTWSGNARVVLESTHQATRDTRLAEKLYKRAYDTSKDRELRAKAAYYASKAELARIIDSEDPAGQMTDLLPVPTTWFPALRSLADTHYYKEVLRECGNFRRWIAKQK